MDRQNQLELNLSARDFLWSSIYFVIMIFTLFNNLLKFDSTHPLLVLVGIFWGIIFCGSLSMLLIESPWAKIQRVDEHFVFIPHKIIGWMPRGLTGVGVKEFKKGNGYVVPSSGASIECIGRNIILHTQPEHTLRLGRGQKGETIISWLKTQGLGDPIGR